MNTQSKMNDGMLKKLFYTINSFTESKYDNCHFNFQTRFLYTKDEYKKEKMYPTYMSERESQDSDLYVDDPEWERLNELIAENLFDVRGVMYYGTYSMNNIHYFYIIMIPFFEKDGGLDWSKAKAFEECF